ncbi:MAG: GIY-YIG nuclease family protein [Sphingomonadales bacterium]|nr:GIY-YIG nuclease family protein [Sphingomonadales bacterium]
MKGGAVYILANKRNGTLYIGVTSNLVTRIAQHRSGEVPGFSQRYGTKTLVYYEAYDDISEAILREKRLKKWNRSWKIELIEGDNPQWRDLYDQITGFPLSRE